jgi:hypothetical protein
MMRIILVLCAMTASGLMDSCSSEESDCEQPDVMCSGTCVDPRINENHCGICGNRCVPGETCMAGQCVFLTPDAGGDADAPLDPTVDPTVDPTADPAVDPTVDRLADESGDTGGEETADDSDAVSDELPPEDSTTDPESDEPQDCPSIEGWMPPDHNECPPDGCGCGYYSPDSAYGAKYACEMYECRPDEYCCCAWELIEPDSPDCPRP